MHKSEQVPKPLLPIYEAITAITNAFCDTHLNAEYAQHSRQLAAALSRKRPSPLLRGKVATWACGIVYALGSVNFLGDRSSEPSMRMDVAQHDGSKPGRLDDYGQRLYCRCSLCTIGDPGGSLSQGADPLYPSTAQRRTPALRKALATDRSHVMFAHRCVPRAAAEGFVRR
jgi:hypothetical protein